MAISVEDGSGVSDAVSYVTVTEANTYWSVRAGGTEWTALSDAQKEQALIRASSFVDNQKLHPFRGTRKTSGQGMQWPRVGAVERFGPAVESDEIPGLVKRAVMSVSLLASTTDLEPVLSRGGRVTSESVGPISRSYAPDAPGHDVIMAVEGMLAPLIRDTKEAVGMYVPTESTQEDGFPFRIGMHDHNG